MAVNAQYNLVSGAGGGSGGGDSSVGSPPLLYRVRGVIDASLGRLPGLIDLSVETGVNLFPFDAFVCTSAGTPVPGVVIGTTGVTAAKVGDFMVYGGGDSAIAASWTLVSMPSTISDAMINSPPRYVRIVAARGATSDAS